MSPDCPRFLLGDQGRLDQILQNLLGNALKFTPKGRIDLEVSRLAHPGPGVMLRFLVADTGIGIAPQDLPALFLEFNQLDNSIAKQFGGTGLGLAISKRLVEMMGGTIGVESEPRKGSRFHFTVLFGASRAVAPAPGVAEAETPARALRVLVAEDNESARKVLLHVLAGAGHAAVAVENGQEALDALAMEPFDCVLMDVNMPGMDGVEATRLIRASSAGPIDPRTPIVALTAYAMEGDKERFLAAGMDDYLTKPVTRSTLLSTVSRLADRSPAPPATTTEAAVKAAPSPEFTEDEAIDFDVLLESYSEDFVRDLFRTVLDSLGTRVEELEHGLAVGDLDQAADSAHSLAGSAGSVQARPLLDCAQQMQRHALSRDLGLARRCLPRLQAEASRLAAALQSFLTRGGSNRPPTLADSHE